MITFALALARMGWPVHPVHGIDQRGLCTCGHGAKCRSAGKHPVLTDWAVAASTDPDTILNWSWDGYNLGVVPRDLITILDFDGAQGARQLERMSLVLPDLPEDTPVARTGSGGYHIYIAGSSKTRTKLLPGLDIRGVGGQAVVPPSVHHSGGRYEWLNPPNGLPPTAPEWLAVARGEIPDNLKPAEIVTRSDLKNLSKTKWGDAFRAVLKGQPFAKPGQRNAIAASLAGVIAKRWPYADVDQILDLFTASLDVMGGEPTPASFRSMLERFQENQRADLKRRPKIYVSPDIEGVSDQALEALAAKAQEYGIYSRGGELVRVRPSEGLPDGVMRGELPSAFETLAPQNLTAHLSSAAQFVKKLKSGDESSTYPPQTTIARIDRRGYWPGIKHAERITHGMSLRPDGTVFRGGGYDELTGTVSLGHPDPTPLVSVDESLDVLRDVVSDFPFAGPEAMSAWLASVLTSVGQPVFRGPSPLFLIDANVRAAGKTLLAEISIQIASGKSPTRATLGANNEEDRKQITAMAISGAQCILVDNVSGLFGTPKLCEALSLHDSGWSDRILGKSKTWSGPFKPTWWATSNNIRLQPDISRRTCYIRLDSMLERPELRSGFRRPSLLAWVAEHRDELYRAAISILHHYIDAGRPEPTEALPPWGTFEGWSGLVRHALVWAGLPDPAETRAGLAIADEEQDLLGQLIDGLRTLDEDEFTPSSVCSVLYGGGLTIETMTKYSVLRDALDAGCVQRQLQPTPQSVGKLFTRFRERVCGGFRLTKMTKNKRNKWKIEEVGS